MDIIDKMEQAFSKVETINMYEICPENYKVRNYDFAFVCYK